MDLIEAFKTIGFTKQETELYLTLCEKGELTGYEAAKTSGISRSNAYTSLSSLVDKGGASILEGQPTKYIATPKQELLINAKRAFEKVVQYIDEKVVFNTTPQETYITIVGYQNIVNKIENMLSLTNTHLYFSAESQVVQLFIPSLLHLANDKKVVLLSDKKVPVPSSTYYPTKPANSFKLIVDTHTVITGTLEQCLYSKNKTLVQLIREAIMNEIKLIQYEQ